MDMTFFAKILGPVLVFFALFNIFFRSEVDKVVKNFTGAHGAYWLEALISMIIGLAVVNAQGMNYSTTTQALLPIFGWICFIKGFLLLFFGSGLQALWSNTPNRIMIGALRFVFGYAFICIGYFS